MNKQKQNLFVAVLLLSFALFSCKGTVDETYTNVIPADASVVISANLNELMSKAGYKDYQSIGKAVEDFYAETITSTPEIVNAIMENPEESGIDLDAPVYLFGQPDGASLGIVLRISDKQKAEAWLQPIADGQGTTSPHRLFWDEKTLLIYEKNGSAEWQQPATPEAQFNQTESFKKMKEQKGEIRGCFLTRDLVKKYSYTASTPDMPFYGQTSIVGACSFEKGAVVIKAALVANSPEATEALATFKTAFTPAKGKYADFLPGSTTMAASISGKGSAYLDYLTRTPGAEAMLATNYRFWKGMAEAINGEAVLALTGISGSGFSLVAYADLDEAVTEAQVKELLSRWSLDKDHWCIDNCRLYWTNDKALANQAFKKASPSFGSSDYGKRMDGSSLYLLMDNAGMAQYSEMQQAMSQMGSGLGSLSTITATEFELNKDYEFVVRVSLKDKKENALKQFAKLLMN